VQLAYARQVVIVPGYGMAPAQASTSCESWPMWLEERGVTVKYAIPSGGGADAGTHECPPRRGECAVLLVYELEQINPELPPADLPS